MITYLNHSDIKLLYKFRDTFNFYISADTLDGTDL